MCIFIKKFSFLLKQKIFVGISIVIEYQKSIIKTCFYGTVNFYSLFPIVSKIDYLTLENYLFYAVYLFVIPCISDAYLGFYTFVIIFTDARMSKEVNIILEV